MCTLRMSAVAVALAVLCAPMTLAEAKVVLVKDGKPQASIVTAAQPSKNAQAAAEELQRYVEKMSSAKLPIVTDDNPPQGALVLVGPSKLTAAIKDVKIPTGVTKKLAEEGLVIFCKGDRLVLAGNDTEPYMGTRYAVCELLNRLGVRWFLPGDFGEVVPKLATIEVGEMNVSESPDFAVRDAWEHGRDKMPAELREWKIHNKFNPDAAGWIGVPGDSSVRAYLPADLFKAHPDWFALQKDGKRADGMPCMTNPDMIKHFIELIKKNAREGKRVSVIGADDGLPRCLCDNCKKLTSGFMGMAGNEPDPDYCASISQEWFTFIDTILDEVNKEFPEHTISTNGYANRDIPPELPHFNERKNLVIMFANIPACTIHSYTSPHCWEMRRQAQMLRRWCQLCDKVWIYSYNRTMLVGKGTLTPVVTRLRNDLPLVKQWGGIGYLDEDVDDWSVCGVPTHIVRTRLEWDTGADVDALLNDYFSRWFGAAAKPMRAFYDTIEEAFANAPQHGHEDVILAPIYSDGLLAALGARIAEAEKLAQTDTEKLHVRLERLIYDTLTEYAATEKAKQECKYDEAIKRLDRMIALKAEMNKITPFMGAPMYTVYCTDWEKKRMEDLLAKTAGKDGELLAVMPREAPFRTDPDDDGIYERWMLPHLDETAWKNITTARGWQDSGYHDEHGRPYMGLGWYRFSVKVPGGAKGRQVFLCGPALVNTAWVWVNGQYAGRREYMCPWFRPQTLDMDISKFIKPGEENQITMRVFCSCDCFGANGIYERMFIYAKK